MKKLIVAALAASLSAGVMAAGDAAAGKNKVAACAGCHGMNGKIVFGIIEVVITIYDTIQ